MNRLKVLIIDDSPEDREYLLDCLQQSSHGLVGQTVDRSSDAYDLLKQQRFDCVLLDYRLQSEDGLDVLSRIIDLLPNCPVIMLTGQGSEKTATAAMKRGAADYLTKGKLTSLELETAVINVIERAQMKQRLEESEGLIQQQSSLESLGQLSAGIAHDFNNVATAISMALDSAAQDQISDKTGRMLGIAQKALGQVSSMADRLLSFSSKRVARRSSRSCQQVLSDLELLVGQTLITQADVSFTTDHPDTLVRCDQNLLLNALLNLVLNAKDAVSEIESPAQIMVRCLRETVDSTRTKVVFEVQDNGVGMSVQAVQKATDPFYSTKVKIGGTGLGLAMVASFAKQNGGALQIGSKPDGGTTVRLSLPEGQEDAAEVNSSDLRRPDLSENKMRILLVEDETALRHMLSEELEAAGHMVHSVGEAADALLFAHVKTYDVLITDISLPGTLNGFELAKLIRESFPETKIIGMSGYHKVGTDASSDAIPDLMSKPFDIQALLQRVAGDETG